MDALSIGLMFTLLGFICYMLAKVFGELLKIRIELERMNNRVG